MYLLFVVEQVLQLLTLHVHAKRQKQVQNSHRDPVILHEQRLLNDSLHQCVHRYEQQDKTADPEARPPDFPPAGPVRLRTATAPNLLFHEQQRLIVILKALVD